MADPKPIGSPLAELAGRIHALEVASLKHGGGDGTSGGMEARIASLEAHMDHVRTDVARLSSAPERLTGLEVKVDQLPSKEWTFKTLVAMLSALAVIVGLIVRFVPHA